MTLIQKFFLNYGRNVLANIENINYGGCGIAVYAIYLYLKRHNKLPKDFQVVTLYKKEWFSEEDPEEYVQNYNFVQGNANEAKPCHHFAFMVNGKIMDSNKEIELKSYSNVLIIPADKTESFLQSAINSYGWNPDFEREVQIPIIESKLKIKLS